MIKRKYWSTFYSLETGGQNARAYFLENDDDEKKSLIFKRSPVLWAQIKGQVKEWTLAKWSTWEEEKPDFFTAGFQASVPNAMIPVHILNKLKHASGGQRKGSSVLERIGLSGIMPHFFLLAPNASSWDDDLKIDLSNRAQIVSDCVEDCHSGVFSKEEEASIELARKMIDAALRLGAKKRMKRVNTKNFLLTASTFLDESNSGMQTLYGSVKCTIRTSALNIIAFHIDNESKCKTVHDKDEHCLKWHTIEHVNKHHSVFYYLGKTPKPFRHREFVGVYIWKKIADNQYLTITHPTDHDLAPADMSFVRAENTRAYRLTEVKPGVTNVELVFLLDLKGHLPTYITENIAIPNSLASPAFQQEYFLQAKEYVDFDEGGEDAAMLGSLLMIKTRTAKNSKDDLEMVVATFFHRTAALRYVQTEFPWFDVLIITILRNKLRHPANNKTELSLFAASDAEAVGRSFSIALLSNTTHEAAIEEWTLSYPAMRELERKFGRLFLPFLSTIAKCLLEGADWGLKMRVVVGALLSVLDMTSDIYMINQFYEQDQVSAARATIAMIAANMFVQLLIVYAQNSKRPKRVLLFETIFVITCIKPGIDALRVMEGGDVDPLLNLDPMAEMGTCARGGARRETAICFHTTFLVRCR